MGVPIDLHVFEDDHRAGKRCHPGNLGYDLYLFARHVTVP